MIQEKDFLYRVPVKTAPITTPGGQIRNPEILVDVEGGEFMHGNILDANSTNKLINQSVKDAVDNKLIESGYVTKDLLEAETTRATEQENSLKTLIGAETSARTKGDEDLSSKIKAEQTRAEGKEKEISDKLAIVNGDSNTEGSFRKAIADVVAAAPEDLDTLKEIADKLAGNDDLHTALNQAITEKADASALLNEVTRATGAESGLQAAIATKADATALGNYVLTTALNKQVDTLNAAISAKQDAGNYIPYARYENNEYIMLKNILVEGNGGKNALSSRIGRNGLSVYKMTDADIYSNIQYAKIELQSGENRIRIEGDSIVAWKRDNFTELGISDKMFSLSKNGVAIYNGDNNHVLTSNASTIDITQYAKKTELPTVPTKTSQLTNDSNFITAADVDEVSYRLQKVLKIGDGVYNQLTIGSDSIISTAGDGFVLDGSGITFNGRLAMEIPTAGGSFVKLSSLAGAEEISELRADLSKKQDKGNYVTYISEDNKSYTIGKSIIVGDTVGGSEIARLEEGFIVAKRNNETTSYSVDGIRSSRNRDCLATSDGTFKPISDFVLKEEAGTEYVAYDEFASVKAGLNSKQNKITVNSVDVTNLETADITQLRAIVKDLLTALDNSGLIISSSGVE